MAFQSVLPRAVQDLTKQLYHLPGIGPKTAQRLAVFLLRQPAAEVAKLAQTIQTLHEQVKVCSTCFTLTDQEQCIICRDTKRERNVLCVVEDPLDVEAIERTESYHGLYHVLGGILSPLDGIGAKQLTFGQLFARLTSGEVTELIIALDHTMESEATARHITSQIQGQSIKITRLARGLPTGGDIEFADALTLAAALHGRKQFQ